MLGYLVAGAAGLWAASKAGVLPRGLLRPSRSTAPVPSAQTPGQLVAPSIPGHVIPTPSPVDPKTLDVGGSLTNLSNMIRGATGEGTPYVDAEGYWRSYPDGALYQFHDPNSGKPIGQAGFMPNAYKAWLDTQTDPAINGVPISGSGSDAGATAAQIAQGVTTAASIAAGAAGAASGGAGATAAAVGAAAASALAALGPMPVGAKAGGWDRVHVDVLRVEARGGRTLQVAIVVSPDGRGWIVFALEVRADDVRGLALDALAAAGALYQDHAHQVVGLYGTDTQARNRAEDYARLWALRREAEALEGCECGEIDRPTHPNHAAAYSAAVHEEALS